MTGGRESDVCLREDRAAVPSWVGGGHIPGLDGLRAVAILMVITSHLSLQRLYAFGAIGVDLFFVLSGFLITLLLLRERDRTSTISLRGFYIRRALRILPAYFVFLLGAFLMSCLGVFSATWSDWIPPLTHTTGFFETPVELAHTWSLATEEHFYLVWPLVFFLLPNRASFLFALAVFLAGPVCRLIVRNYFAGHVNAELSTPVRIDGIAAGCCLAFVARSGRVPACLRSIGPGGDLVWFACVSVSLFSSVAILELTGDPQHPLKHSVYALSGAVIIWISSHRTRGPVGWALHSKPAVAIGTLSYGLYLWQQPFLLANSDHWITRWPVNLLAMVVVSLASYFVVERPFLSLRNQWSARRQPRG